MFCINCGKQVPDDAIFCPKCGTKIFVESTNQSNTTYTNNQKTNNKVNLNEPFKWHAGAIIWFIILIIICLYTIFFHLQLNALLNIDELSLNINAFYPINQVISLTIATLQILSIIFLLVKRLRFCVYSFFILEAGAMIYNFYQIYNLSQLHPYASYIAPSFIFINFVKILICATITYLVLRNHWQDLK